MSTPPPCHPFSFRWVAREDYLVLQSRPAVNDGVLCDGIPRSGVAAGNLAVGDGGGWGDRGVCRGQDGRDRAGEGKGTSDVFSTPKTMLV